MKLDKTTWNTFVQEHGPRSGQFLQSWEWGAFQKAVGEHVMREVNEQDGKILGVAQWIERSLPLFGTYRYAPKGPVLQTPLHPPLARGEAMEIPPLPEGGLGGEGEQNGFFHRIEPATSEAVPPGAKKAINIQPAHTLITDLSLSEEELLAGMHHKTRYNIRLAGRRGVHVTLSEHVIDDVWHLFEETGSRGDFRLHPRAYYKTMLSSLQGDCKVFLTSAYYEHHPIATTMMIDFGNTRTYLHGASERRHRSVMAPYLLHWELMKSAKQKGIRWYDWWGVAPEGAGKKHPWFGISRFKRGFGGEEVSAPGTYDIIAKPLRYKFYKIARALRRRI